MWSPPAAKPVSDLFGHPECKQTPPEYPRTAQHCRPPASSDTLFQARHARAFSCLRDHEIAQTCLWSWAKVQGLG